MIELQVRELTSGQVVFVFSALSDPIWVEVTDSWLTFKHRDGTVWGAFRIYDKVLLERLEI